VGINISQILNNKTTKYIGVGLIAFSGGTGFGYFIGRKKENSESVHISDGYDSSEDSNQLSLFDEQSGDSNHEGNSFKVPNINIERPWVRETLDVEDEQMNTTDTWGLDNPEEVVVEPENTAVYVNVFKSNDDQWDYEAELAVRNENAPYVIHRDEFVLEEMGYEQTTVTYYAGDDIMTDVNDVPIYNHASMIHPLKFGHGSGDQNVVYIRNESLELEWEVLLHNGRYAVEVLGLEVERHYETTNLAHSHSVLKFRDE
jgi:hypothetical protein